MRSLLYIHVCVCVCVVYICMPTSFIYRYLASMQIFPLYMHIRRAAITSCTVVATRQHTCQHCCLRDSDCQGHGFAVLVCGLLGFGHDCFSNDMTTLFCRFIAALQSGITELRFPFTLHVNVYQPLSARGYAKARISSRAMLH